MIDGIANTGTYTFVEKNKNSPIDIHLHVHASPSMRHPPHTVEEKYLSSTHTGRRRPDKVLGIRHVPWFPTILSLLDVIIPEYNISSDPRSRSGDEKDPLDTLV
jgi:hypothetical protein